MDRRTPTATTPRAAAAPPSRTPAPGQILSQAHIQRALQEAADPSSLDFGYLGLAELGQQAVQELANIGKEYADDEGTVYRSVDVCSLCYVMLMFV